MNILIEAWHWLTTASSWTGENGVFVRRYNGTWDFANDSIIALTLEHLYMTVAAVTIAGAVALPLGAYLGHRRRGGGATVVISNVSRAIPTFALLTLFATSSIGFGNVATIIAVAIFAFPPMLSGAFDGMRGVDADVRDAAVGTGMTPWQLIRLVELPLALPKIASGVRAAAVQTVATIPLAALVAGGGLGVIIKDNLATYHYGPVVGGAILVAALSVAVDRTLGLVERRLTPVPLRPATRAERRKSLLPNQSVAMGGANR